MSVFGWSSCEIAQVFEEVHDVGAVVHVVAFELFNDARVKVFVLVTVFESVVGTFETGGGGGAEVLELGCEAHAHLERVGHCGGG